MTQLNTADDLLETEIIGLLEASLYGEISAEELSRLDHLVVGNKTAQSIYLRAIEDGLRLRGWAKTARHADIIPAADRVATSVPAKRAIASWPPAVAAAACLLLVGYFVGMAIYVSLRNHSSSHLAHEGRVPVSSQATAPTAAFSATTASVIDYSADAVWGATGTGVTPADHTEAIIPSGKSWELRTGELTLRLKQGVTLQVVAPASWAIEGENAATLTQGKVVAAVPANAHGFLLKTPSADIVDLGTEFVVEVRNHLATHVAVRSGKVDVWPFSPQSTRQVTRLTAGQARRVERASERDTANLVEIEAETLLVGAETRLQQWRRHSEQLRRDPALVAYYDFEGGGPLVRNVLADCLHGTIKTPRATPPWTDGRWHDKGALVFGDRFASVEIADADALHLSPPFALSLWVRVDAPPAGICQILGRGGEPHRNYSLWLVPIDGNWHLHASIYDSSGQNIFLHSDEPIKFNLWHQVIVQVDEHLQLGINGQWQRERPRVSAAVAQPDGPLLLGTSAEPAYPHAFVGAIDHLAIYRSALTDAEVNEQFTRGTPERLAAPLSEVTN